MTDRHKQHQVNPFLSRYTLCGRALALASVTVDPTPAGRCRSCERAAAKIRDLESHWAASGVLRVPCTSCGASPGRLCTTVTNEPVRPHMPRCTLARQTKAQEESAGEPRVIGIDIATGPDEAVVCVANDQGTVVAAFHLHGMTPTEVGRVLEKRFAAVASTIRESVDQVLKKAGGK